MQYKGNTIKTMKTAKTFRLSDETVSRLKEIASMLNITETEALAKAIRHYFLALKGEEEAIVRGGLVPLEEYKRTRELIDNLLERISNLLQEKGKLKGQLEVKDALLQEKDKRIEELEKLLEEKDKLLKEKDQKIKLLTQTQTEPWWKRIF